MKKAGTKLMFVEHLDEIAIRGTDYAYIGMNRGAAQRLELSFLHNAKKPGLQLERKIADFVQKQGTVVSPLEPSNIACDRTDGSATLVTERAVGSVAALANGFRN
jgi:hypothetical protein